MKFVLGLFLIALCVLPMHNAVQNADAHAKHVLYNLREDTWICSQRITSGCEGVTTYTLIKGMVETHHDNDHDPDDICAHDRDYDYYISETNIFSYSCSPCSSFSQYSSENSDAAAFFRMLPVGRYTVGDLRQLGS